MKIIINLLALLAFCAVTYGAHLSFGLGPALMLSGGLLGVFSLVAMANLMRGKPTC